MEVEHTFELFGMQSCVLTVDLERELYKIFGLCMWMSIMH